MTRVDKIKKRKVYRNPSYSKRILTFLYTMSTMNPNVYVAPNGPSGAAEFVYNVEQTAWRWLWLFAGIVFMIVVVAILLWLLRKSVTSIKEHKYHNYGHHHPHDIVIERERPFLGGRGYTTIHADEV